MAGLWDLLTQMSPAGPPTEAMKKQIDKAIDEEVEKRIAARGGKPANQTTTFLAGAVVGWFLSK